MQQISQGFPCRTDTAWRIKSWQARQLMYYHQDNVLTLWLTVVLWLQLILHYLRWQLWWRAALPEGREAS